MTTAALPTPATPTTPPPQPRSPAGPVQPTTYKWTVEDFHWVKYGSQIWEGKKVLLIDGELFEMPLPGPLHNTALGLAYYLFMQLFSHGYWVRVQMPLVFGINTDPLPDLAIIPGAPRSVSTNPTSAVFVLEVSDSTLSFDTGEKASLYAAAGITDYWVIDVVNRRVVVHRNPTADAKQKYGHGYASVNVLLPGQSLAPLAAVNSPVTVNDLLP
jgi:Uma2 family endonuclease